MAEQNATDHPFGDTSAANLAVLQQDKMATDQPEDAIRSILGTSNENRETAINAPCLPWLTQNAFKISFDREAYSKADQLIGRMLHNKAHTLLEALIRKDPKQMRTKHEPDKSAKAVRCYCSEKYGLQNTEVLKVLGAPTMIEATNETKLGSLLPEKSPHGKGAKQAGQ